MKTIIHNIRKQPEQVRRHILHVLTLGCAIVLILLWIYSLGSNLTNADTQTRIGQDLKPFSALKDNMVNGYEDLSQPSSNANQNTNSNSNTTDGNAYLRAQENSL